MTQRPRLSVPPSAPWRPGANQMEAFPEIALLAALRYAADMAVNALLALYPEFGPQPGEPSRSPEAQAAEAILPIACALQDAIGRYRTAVDNSWVALCTDEYSFSEDGDAPAPDHTDDDLGF